MDMFVHIFFDSLLTYLMFWYDAVFLVALHKEDAIYIETSCQQNNHHCMMSFHLSIFFVFLWLKDGSNRSNKICLAPLPIRIGSANAGSQVLCEWLPTAIQIPKNCNYTSGNSTWDIHMSSFKHGYVDAILYIFMFHFQGVINLRKRLGMWKFEEARKH